MKTTLRNLKGTADYLPEEQFLREKLFSLLRKVFGQYGYMPMETPIISFFDILASKYAGGSEILKEVYRLSDQGNRELGLRYDLTVPFARYMGMNPNIPLPFKRYEIGKVFRDGPVKPGRKREFYQCDIDIVGVSSMAAEAELFSIAVEIFESLGLDVYIEYNSRNILTGIIKSIGIESSKVSPVITALDKIEKVGKENVILELMDIGIGDTNIQKLFSSLQLITDGTMPELNNDELAESFLEIQNFMEVLTVLGIEDKTSFNPSLARGLDIYTGLVWEIFLKDNSISSSLGAGGRYDSIISQFIDSDRAYPAVGMTFGLDVIYEALLLSKTSLDRTNCDIYIIPLGNVIECMKIASSLRTYGKNVCVDMSGMKLKKSLTYANKSGIPYVMIIGDDELDSGIVNVKNMFDGTSSEVRFDEMKEFFGGDYDAKNQ